MITRTRVHRSSFVSIGTANYATLQHTPNMEISQPPYREIVRLDFDRQSSEISTSTSATIVKDLRHFGGRHFLLTVA
ncbi:MAG: hypothetical protein GY820_18075 [Gammaproteobacteria bacterium]|nr:hypothetical protein [Gammaproteobacteria bacterium]